MIVGESGYRKERMSTRERFQRRGGKEKVYGRERERGFMRGDEVGAGSLERDAKEGERELGETEGESFRGGELGWERESSVGGETRLIFGISFKNGFGMFYSSPKRGHIMEKMRFDCIFWSHFWSHY